ncbi:hypothetical protein D3C84_836830 [compost metagenome]
MPVIASPQDHQQRNVQRWRLIERLVEARQDIEQPAEYAVQFRAGEGETQRPDQETTDCDELRGQQAQGVALEFLATVG